MFKALIFVALMATSNIVMAKPVAEMVELCNTHKTLADMFQSFKSAGKAQYEVQHMLRQAQTSQTPGPEVRAANQMADDILGLVYGGYSSKEIYTMCIEVK